MKKLTLLFITSLFLISCNSVPKNKGAQNVEITYPYSHLKTINTQLFGENKATETLDFIFDVNKLGTTTIIIPRSEWNQLLKNYDDYYKNEIFVHCDFTFEKGGYHWIMADSGFRLRGNTTRIRPMGPDYSHNQGNLKWSDWQKLQGAGKNKYRQSSFKIDFEEFLPEGESAKMAGCMKSVNLKRFQGDAAYVREIYCLDLMRRYKVWTAPRVAYTRVMLNIFEDLTDGSYTELDYGVYEMFENVDKMSLAERAKKVENAWSNNKGNLWKCSEKSYLNPWSLTGENRIGIEDVTTDMKTSKTFSYDLKTNKGQFEEAKAELEKFVYDLDGLMYDTPEQIAESKAWIDAHLDVELLLRTMACNVIFGMDDDYWANANNYYLYFDTAKKGTGKVYMIPFDYDHVFGNPVGGDAVNKDPLNWGKASGAKPGERPLMEKVLAIPEYKELYKQLLMDFTAPESDFGKEKSQARIIAWQEMVKPYIFSRDITYDHDTTREIYDNGGYTSNKYFLLRNPTVWEGKRKAVEKAIKKDF
ncbi:MAG: CotH kinase family protein [Treponema sp.]|nr:CotH kinase family protein [Treponema sp.]